MNALKQIVRRLFGGIRWYSTAVVLCVGVLLACLGYLYVVSVGGTYQYRTELMPGVELTGEPTAQVCDEEDKDKLFVRSLSLEKGIFSAELTAGRPGRVLVEFGYGSDNSFMVMFYVHRNGVITFDDFFGDCTGMRRIQIGVCVYLAFVLAAFIAKLRRSLRENLYRYRNILYYGVIVFFAMMLLSQIFALFQNRRSVVRIVENLLGTVKTFAVFSFPLIVIVSVLVSITHIQLIRREGRTWRNMLGFFLGILLALLCLSPEIVGRFLDNSQLIDVHRWDGSGRFIGMLLENAGALVATYLECILIGTIIVGIKAARRIPKFDKDYIVIHGSMIRKDGSLTKLLQARADRAMAFGRMQKEATGKDIIYVPSGGKGSDEVISEAEAIRRYLVASGIPTEQILPEDRSVSTEENLRFSAELIAAKEAERQADDAALADAAGGAKIAFATTNYHVFRAGLLATRLGLRAEGIGSRTKPYFWINAFIREFVATLQAEKKRHAVAFAAMILWCVLMIVMLYISNVVLS